MILDAGLKWLRLKGLTNIYRITPMLHIFSLNQLLLVALTKLSLSGQHPDLLDAIANYLLVAGTGKQKAIVESVIFGYHD